MGETPVTDKANRKQPSLLSALRTVASWIPDPTDQAAILELVLIAGWALWVGRAYLDFDVDMVPGGREYGSQVQSHHLWTRVTECGWCALWNGSQHGGTPAFADVHGSMLHPLVVVTTLACGVVNGTKLALIVTLWIAGLAQWWVARVLRLGWLARLWSGLAAVVGGHLVARMGLGGFGIFLSTAMCSLVFAPALAVARFGGRRRTILLTIALVLAILAGQGYLQIGLISISPAFLLLILDNGLRVRPAWREYTIAFGLALLIAAPLLVPLARFWPNFSKAMDWNLSLAQPLKYFVLNFIIDDFGVLAGSALDQQPPAFYSMYIGWLPILLAVLCLRVARAQDHRALLFLTACATLALLTASAVPLRWLMPIFPSVAVVRYPSLIGGLAVPPILGLAAYGLDGLFSATWPRLGLTFQPHQEPHERMISLRWLLLIPLVYSLRASYEYSQPWLYLTEIGDGVYTVLRALRTPSLQWVEPPFGEHYWVEPAIRMGLKLSPGVVGWHWSERNAPQPYLEATRLGPPPDGVQVEKVEDIPIYRFDDREYAFVRADDEMIPCQASGTGGDLSVECSSLKEGRLFVRENSWTGWYAWRDGERVSLLQDRWLSVNAPVGDHTYRFRYLPWDVPLGVLPSLLGIALSIWQWLRHPPSQTTSLGKGNRK
jgi:hypothetical protein